MPTQQKWTPNQRILDLIRENDGLRFGYFVAALGATPTYPEMRGLFGLPDKMNIFAEELGRLVKTLDVDLLAGCEFAGVPLAQAVSLETGIPTVFLRKKAKGYGSNSPVEGNIPKGAKVCLIDDASGAGEGKSMFADHVEKAGGIVTDMAVIYWVNHPLDPWYDNRDVTHHQLVLGDDFFTDYYKHGLISQELYDLTYNGWSGHNVERWSLQKDKFEQVIQLAKKDGFPIYHDHMTHEKLVEQSKEAGKYHPLPEGRPLHPTLQEFANEQVIKTQKATTKERILA